VSLVDHTGFDWLGQHGSSLGLLQYVLHAFFALCFCNILHASPAPPPTR